jgi:dynein light intermediate chain 1
MDSVGDELGLKAGWEERTDWVQQVLRTLCMSCELKDEVLLQSDTHYRSDGASLFYTASTQPQTYNLLRQYLLHRFYSVPPPLHPDTTGTAPVPTQHSSRFPFPYRANVLDRDAVMVPAGWDSWGKIGVLRDGFDPARVGRAWETSLGGSSDQEREAGAGEGIEDLWSEMIPDTEKGPKVRISSCSISLPRWRRMNPADDYQLANPNLITTTAEPDQIFLSRQLDMLIKDPNRDPRASFRSALTPSSASIPQTPDGGVGVVGPMGSGGLSLPGVEKAMAEMEGGTAEDMKERFARIARRVSCLRSARPSA